MAKRKLRNYCEVYNEAITILNQRLSGEEENFFFHSIKQLQEETQISSKQIINSIKLLNQINLIHTWQMHWIDKKTNKKSEKHITAFKILEV